MYFCSEPIESEVDMTLKRNWMELKTNDIKWHITPCNGNLVTQPLGVSSKLTSHLRRFDVANVRHLLRVQAQGTSGCRVGVRSEMGRVTCTGCTGVLNLKVGTLKLKNKHYDWNSSKPKHRTMCLCIYLDLRLPCCTQRIRWTQNMDRFRRPMKKGWINESQPVHTSNLAGTAGCTKFQHVVGLPFLTTTW